MKLAQEELLEFNQWVFFFSLLISSVLFSAQNCSHLVASIHSPKDSSVFFTEEGN